MIFGKVRNVASNLSDNHAAIRRAVSFAIEALEGRQLLSASITGTVVNDYSTAPVPGAQVYLDLQGVDKLVAGDPVATTDAVGHYSFSGLSAGNYLVRPVPKAGLAIRSPRYAGDYFLQLDENTIATGKDFSIYKTGSPNFTVNGKVIEAITTPGGAENYLRRFNADGSTDITFGNSTDIGGPRGETFLRGVTGVPTAANASGANIVVNYPTQTVTLDGNGQILSIVPVVASGGTISGFVTRSATPPGIPEAGVTVYLDIPGVGSLTAGDPVTTTDAYGQYAFNNVQPGNYLVRIVPPAGTVVQAPVFGAKYFVQLGANQTAGNKTFNITPFTLSVNGQPLVYNDNSFGHRPDTLTRYLADGETDLSFGVYGSVIVQPDWGGAPTAAYATGTDTVVTFPKVRAYLGDNGFLIGVEPILIGASITGSVYFDTNNNGVLDTGEHAEQPAIGRQVYLDLKGIGVFASGDPIATIDFSGYYSFTNLSAGNYLVRLIPQAGSVITSPVYGGKYFVQLAANQHVTGDDFGTQDISTPSTVSATQADGKILVAHDHILNAADSYGRYSDVSSLITRFNTDGTVDTTYGTAGTATVPLISTYSKMISQQNLLSLLPNGTTLVETHLNQSYSGANETQLSILDATGKVTHSITATSIFHGDGGIAFGDFADAAGTTADGKILVFGGHDDSSAPGQSFQSRIRIWRYNSDLTLDTSFGTDGYLQYANTDHFSSLDRPTAIRGNADGTLTVTFPDDSVHLSGTGQFLLTGDQIQPVATDLSATSVGPGRVVLRFIDKSTTESTYTVEGSSDGIHWDSLYAFPHVSATTTTGQRAILSGDLSGGPMLFRLRTVHGAIQSDPSAATLVQVVSHQDFSRNNIFGFANVANGKLVGTATRNMIDPQPNGTTQLTLTRYGSPGASFGNPDTTFGNNGTIVLDSANLEPGISYSAKLLQIIPHSDGSMLALMETQSSGHGGDLTQDYLLAISNNGTITRKVEVGTFDIRANYPTNGPLVSTINETPDGKIIMAGTWHANGSYDTHLYVGKMNSDFTPDTTFGTVAPSDFNGPFYGVILGYADAPSGIGQALDKSIFAIVDGGLISLDSTGALPANSVGPGNLTAAATSNKSVSLTFKGNANPSTQLLEVQRLDSNFTNPIFIAVLPVTPGMDTYSLNDTTAQPSTTYYYRVFSTTDQTRTTDSVKVQVTTPA